MVLGALCDGTKKSTDILPVDLSILKFNPSISSPSFVDKSDLTIPPSPTKEYVSRAADELRTTNTPVAFPTETVYGLGADATRSDAVQNIFAAKRRPADNPLIVHVHSLEQLASILNPEFIIPQPPPQSDAVHVNGNVHEKPDPIPAIYKSLITRFWPGPLTIILPSPPKSLLAPEVTAGLSTFGARMPAHPVALALLKASNVPLAAPSANASTKPSPTTASHVYHDLQGRISTIVDGGSCGVGLESTVVDGLSDPPCILRPGGVGLQEIRQCEGWENAVIGYQDTAGEKTAKPKAPGMKYKHYSPSASVVLFEDGRGPPALHEIKDRAHPNDKIGIIRTAKWPMALGLAASSQDDNISVNGDTVNGLGADDSRAVSLNLSKAIFQDSKIGQQITLWDVALSRRVDDIAKGLFAALRRLDSLGVSAIFVEGINDQSGGTAAAIMNRLRKAAEVKD